MSSPRTPSRRRYNSWFVTVPLLAASLAFALWFYRPTQTAIGDLRAELELKQAALADAASLPLKLQQANREFEETRTFVNAWRQATARQGLAAVLGELADIIAISGAKTTKFEPEPAIRCQYLTRLPLTLACEGTLPQVYRVMHEIEQMPQTIWIEEVHITHERKDAPTVACVLKLAMFTGQSNPADKTD